MINFDRSFVLLSSLIIIGVTLESKNQANAIYAKFGLFYNESHESAILSRNGTKIRLNESFYDDKNEEYEAIDCFGLGSRVAKMLQWIYAIEGDDRAKKRDVRFFFSSRKQARRVNLIAGEQFGLEWTDFNVERRTVIIVHGFLSDGNQSWVKLMEKAFLSWDDVNVIVVDWSARGNSFNYVKAAVNTRTVGNEIARLLHQIVNATLIASSPNEPKWGNLHMVGHSLGAHICGFAANELKLRQNKWNVKRITGLDPANRCFVNVSTSLRLNTNDASFVDVIHTNGRSDEIFAFGSPQSIGHVDFYPNGGKRQPGCTLQKVSLISAIRYPKKLLDQAICSHGYSYLYFTESLISAATKNCTFWGHRWDRTHRRALQLLSEKCDENNCTEMGIKAENHPQRGTFFVATSRNSPYCATNANNVDELRRQLEIDYANEILD